MKRIRIHILRAALLPMAVWAVSRTAAAGKLSLLPPLIDAGVSNLTSACTVTTPSPTGIAWNASAAFGAAAPWFVLEATNGIVLGTAPNTVPVTIRRDVLAALGTYTGMVIVAGGGASETSLVVAAVVEGVATLHPVISGAPRAFAGLPYHLDARLSAGWGGTLYWVTNYNDSAPPESQALGTGPSAHTTFKEPADIDLSLVSKDEHGRTSIDTWRRFQVWNSPPRVNANGPYLVTPGGTVTVWATASDPNPQEQFVFSWQFNPPDGPFTPASASPTATFVFAETHDSYIVCIVSDTWTGAEGTFNAPLSAQAVAGLIVSNQPPAVLAAWRTNGAWSAWAPGQSFDAHRMPMHDVSLRALPSDPDAGPGPLAVEWHESPENPLSVIPAPAAATNSELALGPLAVPGVYRFSVIANNGRHRSAPATVAITVPGIRGAAMAEGFQAPLPVWGAYATAGYPGNTNAFGAPDDTLATRSDGDGWLYLDRPTGALCSVQLQRTVNLQEHEMSNYYFSTSASTTSGVHYPFLFPVTTYAYGGWLADAAKMSSGVPGASVILLIRGARIAAECNEAGGYSFGRIPKAWPVDEAEEGSHYLVFMKDGWTSRCVRRTPAQINHTVLTDVHTLRQTNATVALSGTVRSRGAHVPVAGARVWFGARQAIADANGIFAFTALPPPETDAPGAPTHVLVAEADGYRSTTTVLTNTADGGMADVFIDGGEVYLCGSVVSAVSGTAPADGVIEAPVAARAARAAGTDSLVLGALSRSGFFSVRVPGGCDHVMIHADGMSQCVPVNRAATGTQPVGNDVILVPEPAWVALLLALLPALRRNWTRGMR